MRLIAAALTCVAVLFGAGPVLARTSPAEKPVTQSKPATQKPADLASKGIDLSPTSVIRAAMTEPPGLDQAKGMLRLKGYFPGQPVQINFEMLFQTVDGRWRLFGLAVQQSGPAVAAQSAPAAQNAPQSGPAQ